MNDDKEAGFLAEIAVLLAEDVEYPLEETLLYARLASNMVAPSIFKNLGNQILYRYPDLDRLGDALLDLWEAQEGEERWAEIEYLVRDGRFDVTYVFPEEIDPEDESLDRRERIVRRYFGDKPIVYPPWPDQDADVPAYTL